MSPGAVGPGADLKRLGAASSRILGPAVILALVSSGTGLLFAAGLQLLATSWFAFAATLLGIMLVWFHAVFIAALTWKQLHPARRLWRIVVAPGLAGGAILAAPLLAFTLLDMFGSSHFCADGAYHDLSVVPDWPWLWIGWAYLALAAVPARAIGLAVRERPPLIPMWRRAVLTLPFLPLLALLGQAFQFPAIDCAPPLDAPGWGLFEGGLVLVPLLGLFWFVSCLSLALHSAASVDPGGGRPHP